MELEFELSNSMLRDWEDMCPIAWKARHITKEIPWPETQAMRWGNFFEQEVIGCGVGGRIIELTKEEKASVYYQRTKIQAQAAKDYLKKLGGKIIGVQRYHSAEFRNAAGQMIKIKGGLDIEYQMPDGRIIIIDLKYTGDADNDFGKFAWGKPESMDMSQIIHYGLIVEHKTGKWPGTMYWVFDSSAKMRRKLLEVECPELTIHDHKERASRVYNEIQAALFMDFFEPKNTFENCSNCPLRENSPIRQAFPNLPKCEHERVMPEIIKVQAWSKTFND